MSIQRPCRSTVESALVIGLPQCARIGRQCETSDFDLVPGDPGLETRAHTAKVTATVPTLGQLTRQFQRRNTASTNGRAAPDVAEDRDPEHDPECARQRKRSPRGQHEDDQKDQCCEETVEDLPIDVNVVPDRVRMKVVEVSRR